MLLTAILTAFFLLLGNLALLWLVRRSLSVYFEPQGEKGSEFAQLVDITTTQAATKTAQSLKAVFMGQNSVDTKNATRVAEAVQSDVLTQKSPLLGLAAKQFPDLAKLIANNPGALNMLRSFGGGGHEVENNPGNGREVKEVFSLY